MDTRRREASALGPTPTTTVNSVGPQPTDGSSPELAKCYDEIDQIYDYIRGLAPLPVQLRKIKSIDFEQLDRLQLKQQQFKRPPVNSAAGKHQVSEPAKVQSRARQREASATDKLLAAPEVASQQPKRSGAQWPPPIRLTTRSRDPMRHQVKRVESLNLGDVQPASVATLRSASGCADGGQFRLPRAHSTSHLNKPEPAISAGAAAGSVKPAQNTRTLPALRLSRPAADGHGLSKLKQHNYKLGERAKSSQKEAKHKANDLAEGAPFVDDDDQQPLNCLAVATRSNSKLIGQQAICQPAARESHQIASQRQDAKIQAKLTQHKSSNSSKRPKNSEDSSSSSSVESNPQSASSSRSSSSSYNSSSASSVSSSTSNSSSSADYEHRSSRRKVRADKWTEKSHSDYENETVSLSSGEASSPRQRLICSSSAADSQTSRRRSSSGAGTNSGSQPAGRIQSPDNSTGAATRDNRHREHIYEQIPAHLAERSSKRAPAQHQKTPFNYPVAYAPSVAVSLANRRDAILAAMQREQQIRATRMQHSRAVGHSHRLSMGNIHLLPAGLRPQLAGPLPMGSITAAMLVRQQQSAAAAAAAAKLSRSSSSGQVNKLGPVGRAPRLSPAQLITQIQMPRVVSKRQLQPSNAQTSRPPQHHRSMFLWPHQTSAPATGAQFQAPQNLEQASRLAHQAKRYNGRRLTAIGISEAIEGIQRARQLEVAPAKRRPPIHTPPVEGALRRRTESSSCFEPALLLKGAPLIDDSDGEQPVAKTESRRLNSVSDLHSMSTKTTVSSSSSTKSKPTVDDDDQSDDQSDRTSSSSSSSDGSPRITRANHHAEQGNFVSSSSFIKCYYGREKHNDRRTKDIPTNKEPSKSSTKRSGSDKLFGLIGINRQQQQVSQPSEATARATGQPFGFSALFGGSRERQKPAAIVGEFLNSEGPMFVRDRRITALKSELVRHYEHPTVQVASVPSYRTASSQSIGRQQTPQVKAGPKKQQAALSGSPSLIKVPKLSRQSHLLNRPLPRPPAGETTNSSSMATAARHRSSGQPAARKPPAVRVVTEKREPERQPPSTSRQPADQVRRPLSQLQVSVALSSQHSPTVTTCTSSGISSRVTSATQLTGGAGPSSSESSKRPAATDRKQRVKSLSELHKQSKQLNELRRLLSEGTPTESPTEVGQQDIGVSLRAEGVSPSDFALMDESDGFEDQIRGRATGLAEAAQGARPAMSNNLRLFDERFSSKSADRLLASSDDSLLESINFSGTLPSKLPGLRTTGQLKGSTADHSAVETCQS